MAKKNLYEFHSEGKLVQGLLITLAVDGADYKAAREQGLIPVDIFVRCVNSGSPWKEKCVVPANTDVRDRIIPFANDDIARRTVQSITVEAEKFRAKKRRLKS
jgi:hypothetical protein